MLNYSINSFVRNVHFSKNFTVWQQDESLKRDERSLNFNVFKEISSEQDESFR